MTKLEILIKFKDFIESIMALDKTPEYPYGNSNKKAANRLENFQRLDNAGKLQENLPEIKRMK